ncbi:hypothetical protein [Photobacterium damselae]|uniref:hypothetical protein n=1 Tax=Photobacterium damselae TaxID=38293 RepID=UPI00406957C3
MTQSFSDIANLDKKEQPLAYRNLARCGDSEAALEYATLVWKDKYKGEAVGGKVPDAEKQLARQEAVDFLMDLSNNGSLECSLKGAYATFKGIRGAQDKVLCKNNNKAAIQFITNALSHNPDDQLASKLCLMRALSLTKDQRSKEDVIAALDQAASYDTSFGRRAKAHLGSYAYLDGDYDKAITLLESYDNITTAVLLKLIYKSHRKNDEKHDFYHKKALELCKQKIDKSEDL